MRRRRNSETGGSIGLPRKGFSTPTPLRAIQRINNSPTLYFGDVGSFDVSLFIDNVIEFHSVDCLIIVGVSVSVNNHC